MKPIQTTRASALCGIALAALISSLSANSPTVFEQPEPQGNAKPAEHPKGQDQPAVQGQPKAKGGDAQTKPPAWPKVTAKTKRRLAKLIKDLRKKKPALRQAAADELIALGAQVGPTCLDAFSDLRGSEARNAELAKVLDAVTTNAHAPLLAEHANSRKRAARAYVLTKLTSFRLPSMKPVFSRARNDSDEALQFQAQLGLLSAGDPSPLDQVFAAARDRWEEVRPQLEIALPGARGAAATQALLAKLDAGRERDKVTALRLLRYAGEREVAGRLAPLLQSTSQAVKKATINTLRVIVDGAKPLERLDVFKAINMAKEWQKRLGS